MGQVKISGHSVGMCTYDMASRGQPYCDKQSLCRWLNEGKGGYYRNATHPKVSQVLIETLFPIINKWNHNGQKNIDTCLT